jgi:hypothetical protein
MKRLTMASLDSQPSNAATEGEPLSSNKQDNAQPHCRRVNLPPELRVQIYEYCFVLPPTDDTTHEVPLGAKPAIPINLIVTCRRIKDDSAEIRQVATREAIMSSTFTIDISIITKEKLDIIIARVEPDIEAYKRVLVTETTRFPRKMGLTPYDPSKGTPVKVDGKIDNPW